MSGASTIWNRRSRGKRLAVECGLLSGVVLLAAAIVAGPAYFWGGATGCLAAGVAACICWLASSLALLPGIVRSGSQGVLFGVMLGMGIRMVLPLAVGVILQLQSQTLATAGLLYYLLFFYLLTLVVDTALAVGHVQSANGMSGAS